MATNQNRNYLGGTPGFYANGANQTGVTDQQGQMGPVQNPAMTVTGQNYGQGEYTSPQQGQGQQQQQQQPPANNMQLPPGAPQYGLQGAENAMYGGLRSGMGSISRGVGGFSPYMQQGKAANN